MYVNGIAAGKTKKEAAIAAGYSFSTAHNAAAIIERGAVKEAFQELIQQVIPGEKIIERLAEGLNATETRCFVHEGEVIYSRPIEILRSGGALRRTGCQVRRLLRGQTGNRVGRAAGRSSPRSADQENGEASGGVKRRNAVRRRNGPPMTDCAPAPTSRSVHGFGNSLDTLPS